MKRYILNKLSDGDDLERMQMHTRHMTPEQMREPFGHPANNLSNQQYLDALTSCREKYNAVVNWVKSL